MREHCLSVYQLLSVKSLTIEIFCSFHRLSCLGFCSVSESTMPAMSHQNVNHMNDRHHLSVQESDGTVAVERTNQLAAMSAATVEGNGTTGEAETGTTARKVNDGIQERKLRVTLEDKHLWSQFNELTNEMIVTKSGRYSLPRRGSLKSAAHYNSPSMQFQVVLCQLEFDFDITNFYISSMINKNLQKMKTNPLNS